jgi:hypothetical protein
VRSRSRYLMKEGGRKGERERGREIEREVKLDGCVAT